MLESGVFDDLAAFAVAAAVAVGATAQHRRHVGTRVARRPSRAGAVAGFSQNFVQVLLLRTLMSAALIGLAPGPAMFLSFEGGWRWALWTPGGASTRSPSTAPSPGEPGSPMPSTPTTSGS
jgi:hypothetical protein